MERKKEMIDACLGEFIEHGLSEISVRDLSKALNVQTSVLYYYFDTKDDIVIACAEEAAARLEAELIIPALKSVDEPDKMLDSLKATADKMAPMMKFLAQVSSTSKYIKNIRPVLDGLTERYIEYAQKFAIKYCCNVEDIEPYFYVCITAISNYMIFQEEPYVIPQLQMVKRMLEKLTEEKSA